MRQALKNLLPEEKQASCEQSIDLLVSSVFFNPNLKPKSFAAVEQQERNLAASEEELRNSFQEIEKQLYSLEHTLGNFDELSKDTMLEFFNSTKYHFYFTDLHTAF